MVLELIQREIPTRGIGYVILRDCPEDRLDEALRKGMEKLKKAGAKQVWATSLPEGEPLHPGPVGVWRLTHIYDDIRMECPLSQGHEKPQVKLNLRAPKRSQEENTYLDLVNKAYAAVPGAATLRPGSLKKQNHRFFLAYQGDKPVGAFGLDLNDKVPELVTLAVAPEFQHQGLGRSLLRSALEVLGKVPACALTVASTNAPALSLLQSEGFAQTGLVSGWFEVV